MRGFGARSADLLTAVIGTWAFLLTQSAAIVWWVVHHGIPPWIHDNSGLTIINLIMSIQAAEAFVVVLMSQNRQADRDRGRIEHIARLAERILRVAEAGERANEMHEDFLREVLSLLREGER